MNEQASYIQEDEIDLRELFKTIWAKRWFIIIFTTMITLLASGYVFLKNTVPIYSGSLMVELGQGNNNLAIGITNYDLKEILENKFSVEVQIPKGTKNILSIQSKNINKNDINSNLNRVFDFLITKDKEQKTLHSIYIDTKKIKHISISDTPTNLPKKRLIVTVAFVTGFILSIFLVFFIEFIKGFKEEEK